MRRLRRQLISRNIREILAAPNGVRQLATATIRSACSRDRSVGCKPDRSRQYSFCRAAVDRRRPAWRSATWRTVLAAISAAQLGDRGVQRHRAQVAFHPVADGDRARVAVLFADDEHVRDQLDLGLADLGAELLRRGSRRSTRKPAAASFASTSRP